MSDTASGPAAFRYRAFISYSHRDAGWADWLHKAVERYRVPRALVGKTTAVGIVPARLTPLFRDREELPAATDLSTVITAALESASHLVVLCSPRAAQSKWVNEEILAFKRLGRADRIVAIIVEGEPNSGDPATECFPPALKVTLDGAPTEPVAADARESGDGKDNAKLKLIAGLLGVGLDDLKRREAQAQRRRTLFAYSLTGVFALLAIAAVFFAFRAEEQRARAEVGETEALAQRDRANAAVSAARDQAEFMVTEFAGKLRTAPGAQFGVLSEILKSSIGLLENLGKTSPPGTAELSVLALGRLALANAMNHLGDFDGAAAEIDRVLALQDEIAKRPDTPDTLSVERALALDLRGDARRRSAPDKALADYQAARDLRAKALEAHPRDLTYREIMVRSDEKIAGAYFLLNDAKQSAAAYQAALDGAKALAGSWAKEDWPQRLLVPRITYGLGFLHSLIGEKLTAEDQLFTAMETLKGLWQEFPRNTEIYAELGTATDRYASHLETDNDPVAEIAYKRALGVADELHALDPGNFQWSEDLYRRHAMLSVMAADTKRPGLALYHVRRAIAVLEENPGLTERSPEWREDLKGFRGFEQKLVAEGATETPPEASPR